MTSSERFVDLSDSGEEHKAQEREDPLQPALSPPAVPAWTPELAWARIKQILKRNLLALRYDRRSSGFISVLVSTKVRCSAVRRA